MDIAGTNKNVDASLIKNEAFSEYELKLKNNLESIVALLIQSKRQTIKIGSQKYFEQSKLCEAFNDVRVMEMLAGNKAEVNFTF